MAQNPFSDPVTHNAWQQQESSGPKYGNAYEEDEMNAWQGGGWNPQEKTEAHPMETYYSADPAAAASSQSPGYYQQHQQQQPPAGDAYQQDGSSGFAHQPMDAYQFAGTRYANQADDHAASSPSTATAGGDSGKHLSSYSRVATHERATKQTGGNVHDGASATAVAHTGRPSVKRLGIRVAQLVAAVGHLGFAAGASPFSNHDVPFSDKSCFYFLWAVAILSMIWSFVNIGVYGYRLVAHGQKLRRPILIAIDGVMTVFWGVGTIVEIAKFKCPPGGFDKWCDFYNVSIFFGMLNFVMYLLTLLWDFYGAVKRR